MATINMPPTIANTICNAPSAASPFARPLENGANRSRARTGRPDSASRITCISPPIRIGSRTIMPMNNGTNTTRKVVGLGVPPLVSAMATTVSTMASPYSTRMNNSAAPNTAFGLRAPRSTAARNQARPCATGSLRTCMNDSGGRALGDSSGGRRGSGMRRAACMHLAGVPHEPAQHAACMRRGGDVAAHLLRAAAFLRQRIVPRADVTAHVRAAEFRVELHAPHVVAPAESMHLVLRRACEHRGALGRAQDRLEVRGLRRELRGQAGEQRVGLGVRMQFEVDGAHLAAGGVVTDLAAERVRDELVPVADAEQRHA